MEAAGRDVHRDPLGTAVAEHTQHGARPVEVVERDAQGLPGPVKVRDDDVLRGGPPSTARARRHRARAAAAGSAAAPQSGRGGCLDTETDVLPLVQVKKLACGAVQPADAPRALLEERIPSRMVEVPLVPAVQKSGRRIGELLVFALTLLRCEEISSAPDDLLYGKCCLADCLKGAAHRDCPGLFAIITRDLDLGPALARHRLDLIATLANEHADIVLGDFENPFLLGGCGDLRLRAALSSTADDVLDCLGRPLNGLCAAADGDNPAGVLVVLGHIDAGSGLAGDRVDGVAPPPDERARALRRHAYHLAALQRPGVPAGSRPTPRPRPPP
mmetsp:Transcript_63598/g.200990  ORF Transcript_63598/g.200990 Transcript_63598/m.200990 type:complete len:330 (+) Transcript_63598:1574-2563(+)